MTTASASWGQDFDVRVDGLTARIVRLLAVGLQEGQYTRQRLWKIEWEDPGGGGRSEGYVDLLDPRASVGSLAKHGYTMTMIEGRRRLAVVAASPRDVLVIRRKSAMREENR